MMTNDDGMLSQEEIDALLNIGTEDTDTPEPEGEELLSNIEIDTLGEIGNISFGSSATTLSTLLNQKVDITVPEVNVIEKKELDFTFEPVSIQVNYVQGFTGKNVFIIKASDAAVIADIMLGGNGASPDNQLSDIHLSAVQEAMNQMMGSAATSMSTIFNKKVDISPPSIIETTENSENVLDEENYVKISFRLRVGDLIDSNMMQLMPISFAKQVVDDLLNGGTDERQAESEVTAALEQAGTETSLDNPDMLHDYPRNEQQQNPQFIGNKNIQHQDEVQDASFSNFEKVPLKSNEQRNLDMLLDIPLNVTVELGRTKRPIKDILDFSAGSIIELDKLAGEPVDILVNSKLIATGEVVVIDENFGVRVTDIISKSDRLLKLK
ncbi:flagellar motor switch phosphatase FliY [Oceanobacillus halophilus]|uniref:Flagellar motor switch phosphatase FliY n=1 Tax=Oceanobacillus halophilus TaxID=930130 RepID=A0A495AD40_9BACI|nr:flagellar motor switch phosphatase FliY [Oceanobacillus halophilus]RKQ37494.1 flagellar motor switch phosphatase FliY [Oceanobacillus halophilus]